MRQPWRGPRHAKCRGPTDFPNETVGSVDMSGPDGIIKGRGGDMTQ
jgi:hypothetical protein